MCKEGVIPVAVLGGKGEVLEANPGTHSIRLQCMEASHGQVRSPSELNDNGSEVVRHCIPLYTYNLGVVIF